MEGKQKYTALLRGINVGGHHKVPMAELKKLLEGMGFADVKTLLNSGNIIFNSTQETIEMLEDKMSSQLENRFGFPVPVLVREGKVIQAMISADPFKDVEVTKNIRLYVTFLQQPPEEKIPFDIPWTSDDDSFKIISATEMEIFSILDLSRGRTVDSMAILEKNFGKNITTRNWNTILRIGKLL